MNDIASPAARIEHLNGAIPEIAAAIGKLSAVLELKIQEKTVELIERDSEQTRGAIKALKEILALPAALQSERDQIIAGLSEQSDPDF